MYRPEPPTSTGTLPRALMSAMTASARSWYSATLAVCGDVPDVEQVMRDAPALGSTVSLAVPMSMPR